MKGEIIKNMNPNFYNGEQMFRIIYKGDRWECSIKVPKKDMAEFIDDIMADWIQMETSRLNPSLIVKNGKIMGEKSIITKQEEKEQDSDELEMDSETETYDNPFPTDEALDFDVNVRERV